MFNNVYHKMPKDYTKIHQKRHCIKTYTHVFAMRCEQQLQFLNCQYAFIAYIA